MSPYLHTSFSSCPYLIDLMILEIKIEKEWGSQAYTKDLQKKKQAIFMVKEVMDNYEKLYTEKEI